MEKKSQKTSLSLKHSTASAIGSGTLLKKTAAVTRVEHSSAVSVSAPPSPISKIRSHHQQHTSGSGSICASASSKHQRSASTAVIQQSSSRSHHHSHHHHHHSSSRHQSVTPKTSTKSCLNNNNNNNTTTNNNNNNSIIIKQAVKQTVTTTASSSNNNNNNNSTSKNMVHAAAAAAEHRTAQSAVPLSKMVASRNKNEEAVSDLLKRIPEIENIFDVHSRIGNGTFSTVLLGTLKKERDLPDGLRRKFAIKHHIPTSHPDRIMKELQCMAKIGGTDNVVGINCCIRYNESVAFIMPYMPHDRFHDFFNRMDLSEVQHYMKNLLIALRHVHKFNVIHRDVKPSNFLYNRRKRQFLLVDFGLAQQVHPLAAVSNASASNAGTAGSTAALEGKRSRELGEAGNNNNGNASDIGSTSAAHDGDEVSGVAKRLRCSGPHGDEPVSAGIATRTINSCSAMNNNHSPFKMPLKQLNEIGGKSGAASAANSAGVAAGGGISSTNHNDASLNRQVKSAVLTGMALGNRLQQKLRAQQGQSICGGMSAAASNASISSATDQHASASASGTTTHKYNTNRSNLHAAGTTISTSMSAQSNCNCYGSPQVCNICLIKKEIHASRAGTPGYRPPEVLLKYADQTTAVDVWASGVIFLSILSSVYPFFKAPNDYVALAEMVTIFGDKTIRKTAFVLDRLVTLSQKTKPLDLRKLCVRFRNRTKFSSPELLKKYQHEDGTCEVCKNCDQFFFNCLCADTHFKTEPFDSDDPFPASAYDLLLRLLEVNPHKRITADDALKHPFFNEVAGAAITDGSNADDAGAQKKRHD